MDFFSLRKQHPRFIYDSYQAEITPDGLKITHHFLIEPDIEFHPTVTIKGITSMQWHAIPEDLREAWIFHLGLAEIPSYWKATASPEIIIKAGFLDSAQISWWSDLLIKGMGEYFFVNQIDFTQENFINWTITGKKTTLKPTENKLDGESKYLVPVGGGKDSTLTLCFLNQNGIQHDTFLLNPTPAMQQIVKISQPKQVITAQRQIDPKLLELNQKGYLNGHIPFSAYLAFLSRFAGLILGHQSVVISNERSSNEGNVLFHHTMVNHQYSKTYEFEQNFEQYLKKHSLVPKQDNPSYFSILRPLYELQISRLFTQCPEFDQYTSIFRSCNRGQKTNSWCGQCPKCLFAFISFYPFIPEEELIKSFGQNLLVKESLVDEALALLGKNGVKPFECVGTHEENIAAFYLCVKKAKTKHQQLPLLLQRVWDQVLSKEKDLDQRSQDILISWNKDHQIPDKISTLLKNVITNT